MRHVLVLCVGLAVRVHPVEAVERRCFGIVLVALLLRVGIVGSLCLRNSGDIVRFVRGRIGCILWQMGIRWLLTLACFASVDA